MIEKQKCKVKLTQNKPNNNHRGNCQSFHVKKTRSKNIGYDQKLVMIIYNVSFQSRTINKVGPTISAIITVQMILCWSHIVGRRGNLWGVRATLRVQSSFLNLPTDPHPDHHNPPHRERVLNHLDQPIVHQEQSPHNASV